MSADHDTLKAYEAGAAGYAADWHEQPPPHDLHELVQSYFRHGPTADIGCGAGREVAWLTAHGYPAVGYDASAALLAEARQRYPALTFDYAALPELAELAGRRFDNVLCETVIMHLPRHDIAAAVRSLVALLNSGGTLYLSWRVTEAADLRDPQGRLYAAFPSDLVRGALVGTSVLFDQQATSASSRRTIHRMIARRTL